MIPRSVQITFGLIIVAAAAVLLVTSFKSSDEKLRLREAVLAELQPVALKNCALARFGISNGTVTVMGKALAQTPIGTAMSRGDTTSRSISTIASIPRAQSAMAAPSTFTTNASRIGASPKMVASSTHLKIKLGKMATPAAG